MDENRKDREKLEQLKKQYEQINMSERQVEQMKKRIDEAKLEKLQAQQTQQSQEAIQRQPLSSCRMSQKTLPTP